VTVDDRLTFDFGDILALQIECANCHTTISASPEKFNAYVYNCPGCNEELWGRESLEHKLVQGLAITMKRMRELSKEAAFQVRIQVAHHRQG
jgi:hypothetical protein